MPVEKRVAPKPADRASQFDWRGAVYNRVDPGIYTATVSAVIPPEWVRLYHRWVVKIIFTLIDDLSEIPLFLNLGTDEKCPSIARNSGYGKWWAAANGSLPSRDESMLPDVFMEGQIYTIEVVDAVLGKGSKLSGGVYSKVSNLIDVRRSPPFSKHEHDVEHEHEHDVEHEYELEERTSSSTSSSGPRSPHHAHPIKVGTSGGTRS